MWWSCQALQTKQNWVRSAVKRELSGRWGKSNLGDSEGDIQLYFHLCSRETILWCGTEQIMKTSHRMEHINAVNFGSQGVKGDFCIEKCYECIFFFIIPFTMHPPFAVFASLTCSFRPLKQQYSCLQQSPVLFVWGILCICVSVFC